MTTVTVSAEPDFVAAPASDYSIANLVEIYNQTRVDYIVPMPMNEVRMQEYIDTYDIDLDASVVVFEPDMTVLAVSMLGFRDDRAWITRLGVLPNRRRGGTGQFIMDHHLRMAARYGASRVQLEVIKNNTPAHRLFLKNDFRETRELLIVRRASGAPDADMVGINSHAEAIDEKEIIRLLEYRAEDPAWTEDTHSILNINNLTGLRVETPSGAAGSIIFQQNPFQLSHFVFSYEAYHDPELALSLLYHVHVQNPTADTKVENVPLNSVLWPIYQQAGYVESFRRIEMMRPL